MKPKKPKFKTISLTFPNGSQRFICYKDYDGDTGRWNKHRPQDGDAGHLCHYKNRWGRTCFQYVCSEHWDEHEVSHTLSQLGGN